MEEGNLVYLVGSFHGFRDRIILALPHFSFADPRIHRQSSVAKLVVDDLGKAERCPITMAVFPKGKSRGVMTYAEIGVAFSHGNYIILIDENEKKDPVLEKIADLRFNSIDQAIEELPKLVLPHKPKKIIQSKYPSGFEGIVPNNRVCIAGEKNSYINQIIEKVQEMRPDRKFVFATDIYDELCNIERNDLLVTYFPERNDWNRDAILLMGGAYAHDISNLIVEGHRWKYPPLQGVPSDGINEDLLLTHLMMSDIIQKVRAIARRHGEPENYSEYITEVDDLNIVKEAMNMYNFFKKEREQQS